MKKLDSEPRLSGASPQLMDWARLVALVTNSVVDAVTTVAGYFTNGVLKVANGGTGANTAAGALTNLGAVAKAGDTMTGNLTIQRIDPVLALDALPTSNTATVNFRRNGQEWWVLDAYTGDNDFYIDRYVSGAYVNSPVRISNSTGLVSIDGTFAVSSSSRLNGVTSKAGFSGAFGSNNHNWFWSGSGINAWIDNTMVGTLAYTSDERVKHSIRPLEADRAAFLAIRPIAFHYEDIGVFVDDGEHWGFSAQNLLECLPLSVQGSPDALLENGTPNPMNVQDRPILAQTVLLVQQLITTTEAQAQLIAALRAELDILKGG